MSPRDFSDTDIAQLADSLASRMPANRASHVQNPAAAVPDVVTCADFDRLTDRVDEIQQGVSNLGRLEERMIGLKESTSENDRRLAESLERVTRSVDRIDRRTADGMALISRTTSEEIGKIKAATEKAHSRIDAYRDRIIGGAIVAGAVWAGVIWLVEHWTSVPRP
jgi:hypothetical protein